MIQRVSQRAFAGPAEPRHPEHTPLLAHNALPGGRNRARFVPGQNMIGDEHLLDVSVYLGVSWELEVPSLRHVF